MNSLGEFLRLEREKRGVTSEQLASATKISVRSILAIEADQYDQLPAKPFVRGFVISYSKFIGLDPKEVLTQYGDFLDENTRGEGPSDAFSGGYAFDKRDRDRSRLYLWLIMSVFVVLGGLAIVFLKPNFKYRRKPKIDALVTKSAEVKPDEKPVEAKADPETPPGEAPEKQGETAVDDRPRRPDPINSGRELFPEEVRYKVVFKALEDVWVRYRVDEKPIMKFVLLKDRLLVLKAKEQIQFQTSDADQILVRYQRPDYKPVSQALNLQVIDEVPTLVFTRIPIADLQKVFPSDGPFPKLATGESSQGVTTSESSSDEEQEERKVDEKNQLVYPSPTPEN